MGTKGTSHTYSKRASIIKRVLEWIDSGRYDDCEDYIIFGRDDVYEIIEELTGESKSDPDVEVLQKLKSHLRVQAGREYAADRVSLHGKPKIEAFKDLDKLSPEAIQALYERSQQPSAPNDEAQLRPSEVEDLLDAKYAKEMVQRLEKIVEHVTGINPHEVDASQIHNPGLRVCFEEVHRCYLYGFNRACAVMCRALLESALKEKYDPDHKIENSRRRETLFSISCSKRRSSTIPCLSGRKRSKSAAIGRHTTILSSRRSAKVRAPSNAILAGRERSWLRSIPAARYPESEI